MNNRSVLLVLAGIGAAVVLFVVLRSGGDNGAATTTTTSAATTATTTVPATTTTRRKPEGATIVEITVRKARPVGGIDHVKVKQGTKMRLDVTSDTPDEVHLHGYDYHAEIQHGRARIDFTATIAGRFEAELEQHGVQILDLEVTP